MKEASEYLMKTNNNNLFYLNYKIIDNSLIVTVFPNNKSRYVIMDEKKIKRFRRLNVSLKSIFINLYVQVLSFKDTFITTPTSSTITIAVGAETTTSDPTTTTTITNNNNNNNNNNNTYFIKLRGIPQGDPMEGIPQYSGGNRRE